MKCFYGIEDVYRNVTDIVKEKFMKEDIIYIPQNTVFNDYFKDVVKNELKTLTININKKKILISEDDIQKRSYKIDKEGNIEITNSLLDTIRNKNIYLIGPAENDFDISKIPNNEDTIVVVMNRFNDYNNYNKLKNYKNIILFHSFYINSPILMNFLYIIGAYPLFDIIPIKNVDKNILQSKSYARDNNSYIYDIAKRIFYENNLISKFSVIDLELYTELCKLMNYERPTTGMIVLYYFVKNIKFINKLNIIGMSLGLSNYQEKYARPHIEEIINSIHNNKIELSLFKKLYCNNKNKIYINNKELSLYLNNKLYNNI
jgi:hypothetical protein